MKYPSVWTATRNDQLKQLVQAGHSSTEIAVELGSTVEAIKTQRARLGIKAKPARNPLTYRLAALVRMIENETYPARKTALRHRLLGTMAEKYGVRRLP